MGLELTPIDPLLAVRDLGCSAEKQSWSVTIQDQFFGLIARSHTLGIAMGYDPQSIRRNADAKFGMANYPSYSKE
jgi:hypothetical protein